MRINVIRIVVTNETDELARMIDNLMLIRVLPCDLIELPEAPTIETKIGPTFDEITNHIQRPTLAELSTGILDGYPRAEVQPW